MPNQHDTIRDLILIAGDDPDREGLIDTPRRVIKAYQELFSGYQENPDEILSRTFSEGIVYDQMIVVKDIPFVSFCEHHMLPFKGVAHVGYLPTDCVVGLSKIPRVVDCFAKRLQVQERLTTQIADAIQNALNPRGVGVIVEAAHTCASMRGVRKNGSSMITTALRGEFLQANQKTEFYAMVK
jgi:GTP cyclohydrolase I